MHHSKGSDPKAQDVGGRWQGDGWQETVSQIYSDFIVLGEDQRALDLQSSQACCLLPSGH